MSAKKSGLGRGFESLVPTDFFDESFDPTAGDDKKSSELRHIKLDQIQADPEQPRRHFDADGLTELTESIKVHGVLQPIVVTVVKGNYQIVAGERRFRASTAAGLKSIPAIVRTLSAQAKLELALIENLQRRDLNALETAVSYAKLRDQFNLTLEQIGKNVGGRSVSSVSNTLRLLKLPKAVQQAIVKGEISEGQARPLIDIDEKIVVALLPRIVDGTLSARAVEAAVRDQKAKKSVSPTSARRRMSSYETDFHGKYVLPVRVTAKGTSGAGQVVFSFKNQTELDELRAKLLR